jgi:hypothetical protein
MSICSLEPVENGPRGKDSDYHCSNHCAFDSSIWFATGGDEYNRTNGHSKEANANGASQ